MTLFVSEGASLEGTRLSDHSRLHAGDAYAYASYSTYQHSFPYTGDYRIDALLEGYPNQTGLTALGYQWNAGRALGSPVQVTYSFAAAAPSYGGNVDASSGDSGFEPFNAEQKAAVRQIMGQLSQEFGLDMVEVGDGTFSYGQIRFGNNYQETSTGYSWLPFSTPDDRSGDVWLDLWTPQNLSSLAPGSEGYGTLLHEIGHALGLKHPGDYNAGSGGSGLPGNYLGTAEDNETYTVMSYTAPAGGQQRDWFGMYDLLALKTLYGSRNYNAGDTVYSYTDATGRVLKIVDDGSGFDTIDISGVSSAGNRVVDMRPGTFSSIGVRANGQKAVQNVSIDFSTVVEKFVGTAHGDIVTGNHANNVFVLGLGSNVADGGAGIDLVQYTGNRAGYQGAATGGGLQVTGNGASDTLSNVERLAFADSKLALDVGGNAGLAAKILGAVFDAPVIRADPGSAGLALAKVDAGMSYADLLTLALDFRLGAGRTHEQVVDLLYTNIAGAAPTADQAAPYLAQLYGGTFTQASLGVMAAETAENATQIDLVGLAQTGLIYV